MLKLKVKEPKGKSNVQMVIVEMNGDPEQIITEYQIVSAKMLIEIIRRVELNLDVDESDVEVKKAAYAMCLAEIFSHTMNLTLEDCFD